jgi:hypothetical protein
MTAGDGEQKASGSMAAVFVSYASQDLEPVPGRVQYCSASSARQ